MNALQGSQVLKKFRLSRKALLKLVGRFLGRQNLWQWQGAILLEMLKGEKLEKRF
jgi:hypothetical protein